MPQQRLQLLRTCPSTSSSDEEDEGRLRISALCQSAPSSSDEEEQDKSKRERGPSTSSSDEEDKGRFARLRISALRRSAPSSPDEEEQDKSKRERGASSSEDEEGGDIAPCNLGSLFEDAASVTHFADARPLGRPITNPNNVAARRNYRNRVSGQGKLRNVPLPASVQRQAQRVNSRTIKNAQRSLSTGQVDAGLTLAASTLHTTAGQAAFPVLASFVHRTDVHTAVGVRVCNALRNGTVGSAHTRGMVRLCLDGDCLTQVDLSAFIAVVGLTLKYVQKVMRTGAEGPVPRLFVEKYTPRQPTEVAKTPLEKLVIRFFNEHSAVRSGAKRATREVGLGISELQIEFYAEYPKRLRILNTEDPEVLTLIHARIKRNLPITRFQSSLAFAVACDLVPGFDPVAEGTTRRALAITVYAYHLEELRLRTLKVTMLFASSEERRVASDNEMQRSLKLAVPPTELEQCETQLEQCETQQMIPLVSAIGVFAMHPPCTSRSFWNIIKKFKIHWTQHFKPTECPIHDSGPLHEENLNELIRKQHQAGQRLRSAQDAIVLGKGTHADVRQFRNAEAMEIDALKKLEQAARKLRESIKLFHLHLRQYEACRKTIKQIEENLKVGEGVMYRDFVAAYNCDGEKIQNLVLVFLWRSVANGPIRVFKFNNLCGDERTRSADAHYVAGRAIYC